jgi:hypothetical protein
MKLAIAITQLNELELLRANILYHKYLGVEEFLIFSDGSDDETLASVIDIPGVTVLSSVTPEDLPVKLLLHSAMTAAIAQHASHVCARQMVNVMFALEWARARGCDWLLSMDADEFICPNLVHVTDGALTQLFEHEPPEVETLLFRPLEILPAGKLSGSVFLRDHIFLNEFLLDGDSFRSVRRIRREFPDPILGGTHFHLGYLGHVQARSAVRTSLDVMPNSVHYFKASSGAQLVQREIGWSLHFYCYSFTDFIKKFRNFKSLPDRFISGAPYEWVMQGLFREMVNSDRFDLDYLSDYYEKYLIPSDENISAWNKEIPGAVITVCAVREVFEQIKLHPNRDSIA